MICGIAASTVTGLLPDPSRQMRAYMALMGGGLTSEQVVDICYLNFSGLIVNVLALVGMVGALVYTSWMFEWKRHNLLALHNLRLTLVLASILVGICEVAQYSMIIHHLGQLSSHHPGGASDRTSEDVRLETERPSDSGPGDQDDDAGLPMVTAVMGLGSSCFGIVSILVGAVFVRAVEVKDECELLYITLAIQGAQSVVKWCKFEYINSATNSVTSLPTSLTLGSALALAALVIVDGIAVYRERNSSGRQHISSIMSKDSTTAAIGYKTPSVPFLSRITFWWITPLLWRGFVEPLELENLGKLPECDTSRYHYDQFLFIYQRYKRNSSGRQHISSIMSKDSTTAAIGYKTPSVPFLSRITFWWITPLLWRGFVEPLELENLGKLPECDTSRYHYDQFLFIYQRYKNSTHALWRCYVLNCWQMFLAGGAFKLLGDLCALVGPLCISNIVDYIAKPVVSSLSSSSPSASILATDEDGLIPQDDSPASVEFNLGNQSLLTDGTAVTGSRIQLGPLTWTELLANGWFVAVLVLVASLAQGTFSQASTHIMDMEGIKLKNALQGLVYRKTLLLSSSCFYSNGIRASQKVSKQTPVGGNNDLNANNPTLDESNGGKMEAPENNTLLGSIPVKADSTRNRNINTNPTDIFNIDDENATKAMASSVEPVATEHGTLVSTTAFPPPESTTTSIRLQQQQWIRNSTPKIKHEIPAAIDSDDQQQFDIGGSAASQCPSRVTAVSRTKATHKQAKADSSSSSNKSGGDGEATDATLQQGGNRKSSAGRSAHATDNRQGHLGTGGGNATATDAGTITNLMSDDAFNVMSFVKIAHYVWAIPLKIGVVMYLLYRLLGVSTVIGSFVCIITMTPLQFAIGKLMSANSKKASECTDERLRRINEVLLGIKLIKLSAWEGVFREKIANARRKELKHLDRDSCYWTMMMLLTHISSVLITFVTVAVFIHLEGDEPRDGRIEFTAARLFASLALFNQLTVPLFIFPITIPIILSAVVSTNRLEAFLRRPEVQTDGDRRRSAEHFRRRNSRTQESGKSGASLGTSAVSRDQDDNDDRYPQVEEIEEDDTKWEQEGAMHFECFDLPECETKSDDCPLKGAKKADNVGSESSEWESESEQDEQFRRPEIASFATGSTAGMSSELLSKKNSIVNGGTENQPEHTTGDDLRENRKSNQQIKRLQRNSRLTECIRSEKSRPRQRLQQVGVAANAMRFGIPSRKLGSDDEEDAAADDYAVTVIDGRFQWGCPSHDADSENSETVLRIDQLIVPKGKLTIIVGRSGSGKSSLLAALLKEINHLSGEVIWNKYSTIAYVPQRPWLLNANVRDNILFGEPFRPKRYSRVLKACALKPDIELMPDGDMSEIGERGIKLSGGQRQRIVIARALYSPASVVIMDDPLSSLDNEVAKFVFDHGIRRMLTRQKRTAVMVTQMLQLVFRANNIIAMEASAVEATGTLSEIENNYPQILRKWNAIIAEEQQSRETQLSPGRTARERWKLFKNVSRIGFLKRHASAEYYEPPGPLLYRPMALQRHSSSSLFGSRFHTHDLPLPIDECCHGENVQLRRHYSKRYRSGGESNRVVRGFSDGVAAAAGSAAAVKANSHSMDRGGVGNSVVRSRSLQTKRDISSPSHIDGRLLPTDSAQPSLSPTEIDHPSPLDPAMAVAHDRPPDYERFRFSDTCRDWHKIGFRQFLRRMSTRGHSSRGRRDRRHSNSPSRQGFVHRRTLSTIISKTSSVKNLTKDGDGLQSCPSEHRPAHKGIMQQNPLRRLFSNVSRFSEESDEESWEDYNTGEHVSNRLIYDEERKYGKIPARIYWLYLKSCGMNIVTTFFLSAMAQQGLRVYTDFWLQNWTERTQQLQDTNRVAPADIQYNFRVYAVLSAICILLSAICFPAGQKAGSNARRRLHQQLIAAVLKNPIHFFQTVPLGRIMNRLSIDIAVVDKKIAATSQKLLQFILLCLCAVLINSVVTPYFILLTIPICGIYYVVQKFYRCSSRELQRIESITYSPIIAHFSETIEGVTTIRAYQQEHRFTETLFRRMEANNVAQVILNCSNRWLGIALDYLGAVIVFVAILSALITASISPDSTSSSLIGLAINYALLVPIYLNWVVKLAAEMEMYVGAVERIQFYIESSRERARERSALKYKPVPISWPQKGDIVFENVSLRYESQKENVITNLNLTIPTGQRIGICGRTGSGKSSLALALFGVLDIVGGRILIDDVDIGTIHSDELRCRLSIIPQDAMLFGGTLRENLDPRGHFSDLDLWNSLEMAQLKDIVVALPDGLDTIIGEDSSLFSAGQRQLFCLARSVLRGSVCLMLDEATSSLDTETEKLVLDAAGKAFKGRTVLTIAHRLHSLFDYDRVIVLEHGKIIEDGCPRVLRRKSDSKFAIMLKASSTEYQRQQHHHRKQQGQEQHISSSSKEHQGLHVSSHDEEETSV